MALSLLQICLLMLEHTINLIVLQKIVVSILIIGIDFGSNGYLIGTLT